LEADGAGLAPAPVLDLADFFHHSRAHPFGPIAGAEVVILGFSVVFPRTDFFRMAPDVPPETPPPRSLRHFVFLVRVTFPLIPVMVRLKRQGIKPSIYS